MSNSTLFHADGRSIDADIEGDGKFTLNVRGLVNEVPLPMTRDQLIIFHFQLGVLIDATEPAPSVADASPTPTPEPEVLTGGP